MSQQNILTRSKRDEKRIRLSDKGIRVKQLKYDLYESATNVTIGNNKY